MSIEINCKDQKVDDIMRDVKEKSESVIYGGWHIVIGKSNDPIIKFTNLDCLNEDEQHELLGNLDVMIMHLQLEVNSNFGILPIIESKIPTMRKLNLVKSLYDQVVDEIQKNMNNDDREETDNKHVIIDCDGKNVESILNDMAKILDDEVNSQSDVEFINLETLKIEELKELNKHLNGIYNILRVGIRSFFIEPYDDWRIKTVESLDKQVVKEIQRREYEAKKVEEENEKKIEEEYSKMYTEELKNELKELEVVKDHYREWLQLYSDSRIHPTYKENIESILIEVNSKIDVINKILAYRELKNSTNATTKRNEKWKRYNNLEVEELEMILDALNVKCTLRKCELHKCEDNYKSREIKKTTNEILDNIKVIKDVLKCKRGE